MTIEEIKTALKENKELAKDLVLLVPELEEGKTLLSNHAKAHFDANIGSKVAEIYTNIDNDIFETLGIRKKAEQKTYDFLKTDIFSDLKKLKASSLSDDEKAKKIKELEETNKTLLEKSTNSEFWHKTHEEAVKVWKDKENEYETKLKTINSKVVESAVNTDLTMGLSGLKFNANIPKEAVDAMINNVKSEIIKSAKIDENGKVIYQKPDGTPWLGKDYTQISAQGIFAEKLSSIIDTESKGGGGAPTKGKSSIEITGEGDKSVKKLVLDVEKFNSKISFADEVEKTLISNGIERGTAEWNKLQDTAYLEYKVAELPRS